MRVLLINANFGRVVVPTLGLGFLSRYLKEHDIECNVIEPVLQNIKREDILKQVKDYDILGMTMYTENRFEVIDLAKEAKELNNNIKIILGGPHVFSIAEKILSNYDFIDYIIRGEGEEPLLMLIQNKNLNQIPNLVYRNNKNIISNQFKIFPNIDNYKYDYDTLLIKDWKDDEVPHYLMRYNHIPFIASRGCPFSCTFCATPYISQRKWRGYSLNVLVNLIEDLVIKYKIRYFRFYDALFMPDKNMVKDFCRLLKERNLDIYYRIDTHIGVHEEVYEMLKESGCEILGYGIESGSNKILNRIQKNITREQILTSIRKAKKLGFYIIGYFMDFLPDENMLDRSLTNDLMQRFDNTNLQYFKIHPSTLFYYELEERGEINDDVWFDRNFGFKTRFGNEVYYCKELFESAPFYAKGVIV